MRMLEMDATKELWRFSSAFPMQEWPRKLSIEVLLSCTGIKAADCIFRNDLSRTDQRCSSKTYFGKCCFLLYWFSLIINRLFKKAMVKKGKLMKQPHPKRSGCKIKSNSLLPIQAEQQIRFRITHRNPEVIGPLFLFQWQFSLEE